MKQAGVWASGLAMVVGAWAAEPRLSDADVRLRIIADSIATYAGACPCPYSVNRAGRQCGRTSARSKRGGDSPLCFPDDVSDDRVRAWRDRNEDPSGA